MERQLRCLVAASRLHLSIGFASLGSFASLLHSGSALTRGILPLALRANSLRSFVQNRSRRFCRTCSHPLAVHNEKSPARPGF